MKDKQPTQEQKYELLKWCGFTNVNLLYGIDGKEVWGLEPGKVEKDGRIKVVLDLNSLFKYAVLRLIEANDYFMMCYSRPQNEWYCQCGLSAAFHKDPALALFWALWQVKEASK